MPLGGSVGDTPWIWPDTAGRPTTPPPTHDVIVVDEITAGMLTLSGTLMVTAGAFGPERLLVVRRRVRAWERDWAAVEPGWSGRIEH
ncbi:hypothetical protein ACFZBU_40415 [Embleya sp. NPDC008237]|uniref:hypothetical protein n=1 Tax=Embleya sp. NPDC008237 TaxID=3363978 RepID=UPI0036E26337